MLLSPLWPGQTPAAPLLQPFPFPPDVCQELGSDYLAGTLQPGLELALRLDGELGLEDPAAPTGAPLQPPQGPSVCLHHRP